MSKRVLVITSCTGEKLYKPADQLVLEDFQSPERLTQRESDLSAYKTTAGEMYTGSQHEALMNGLKQYRDTGEPVDMAVISAGYGLLPEKQVIVPYEVTFNTMTGQQVKSWSKQLEITGKLQSLVADYDLVFFLLGDKYLQSVEWPLTIRDDQKFFFFAGYASQSRVLLHPGSYTLGVSENEAKRFRYGLIGIKGFLFAKLLDHIANHSNASWEAIYDSPSIVREYIMTELSSADQMKLFDEDGSEEILLAFSEYKPPFEVATDLIAKNYGTQLNFFIPENDDRVDPEYDFLQDYSAPKRDPLLGDVYAHEIYGAPNYDGVLISKVNIDNATKRKTLLIKEGGVRNFLRLPDGVPIMGDCGAFSYISQEMPPYTTEQVLEYYQTLGFDYGVSVDHLIVGKFEKDEAERQRRYNITINNARDFIEKHRAGNYSFTPMGVAQGWDPTSFRDAVQALVDMGYSHIALGGLAKEKSTKIFEILKEIAPVIPNADFRIHLFGVFRDEEIMKSFHMLGVTSFDSASPLRRAWMDSKHNYYTNTRTYTAIRIPEAHETKGRVKKLIQEEGGRFDTFKHLEKTALESVREYAAGTRDIDSTLEAILDYDQHLGGNRSSHPEAYRETLQDQPWKSCSCVICQEIGIDVIIFRGNNRNRRRGFHNTHVYYERLKRMRKEILEQPVPTP